MVSRQIFSLGVNVKIFARNMFVYIYHIILHHNTSHHITSHLITSHLIYHIPYIIYPIWYHTIPYNTIPYHTISYHIITYHIHLDVFRKRNIEWTKKCDRNELPRWYSVAFNPVWSAGTKCQGLGLVYTRAICGVKLTNPHQHHSSA